MSHNYYKPGCWNVTCSLCGGVFKSDEIKKRWDGLLVCKDDWEPRHILDFFRAPSERDGVPFTNPQQEVVFVSGTCPYPTEGGQADIGTADCARADQPLSYFPSATLTSALASVSIADLCYAAPEPL